MRNKKSTRKQSSECLPTVNQSHRLGLATLFAFKWHMEPRPLTLPSSANPAHSGTKVELSKYHSTVAPCARLMSPKTETLMIREITIARHQPIIELLPGQSEGVTMTPSRYDNSSTYCKGTKNIPILFSLWVKKIILRHCAIYLHPMSLRSPDHTILHHQFRF